VGQGSPRYWYRYVETHLAGQYDVLILHDDLSEQEALELENDWMSQCDADKLVNWVNLARKGDWEALDRFHQLRDANRSLMEKTQEVEKGDIQGAVPMYIEVINAAEEKAEKGLSGYMYALNRLTICLVKLGRPKEALRQTEDYLEKYRADAEYPSVEKIRKRIDKAFKKKELRLAKRRVYDRAFFLQFRPFEKTKFFVKNGIIFWM
jgi:hypothetical protein